MRETMNRLAFDLAILTLKFFAIAALILSLFGWAVALNPQA